MFRVVMPRDRRSAGSGCRGCGVFPAGSGSRGSHRVAVSAQGAELQDGFGAVKAPAAAGDFHPVLDQPSGGSHDEATGDGPDGGEERGVADTQVRAPGSPAALGCVEWANRREGQAASWVISDVCTMKMRTQHRAIGPHRPPHGRPGPAFRDLLLCALDDRRHAR